MSRHRGDTASDDALRALGHSDRRRLLLALLEHNPQGEVSIPEEVHVGERELDSLHEGLYHKHLPVLDSLGFVEWDRAAHTVSKGPNFSEIRPKLELLDEHRDRLPDGWV